jgi:hypothetical protein
MLPQLILAALMACGLWFASRWVSREVARVDSQIDRLQRILGRARGGGIPRLELDRATGHYYPVKL